MVERILMDAAVTPVITYEAELSPITGEPNVHADCYCDGLPFQGRRPVLDGGAFSACFTVGTNHARISGFALREMVWNGVSDQTTQVRWRSSAARRLAHRNRRDPPPLLGQSEGH